MASIQNMEESCSPRSLHSQPLTILLLLNTDPILSLCHSELVMAPEHLTLCDCQAFAQAGMASLLKVRQPPTSTEVSIQSLLNGVRAPIPPIILCHG